jgi:hypothetical protein
MGTHYNLLQFNTNIEQTNILARRIMTLTKLVSSRRSLRNREDKL